MANEPEITINRFRAGIQYAAFNDNLVGDVEVLIDNLQDSFMKALFQLQKYVQGA